MKSSFKASLLVVVTLALLAWLRPAPAFGADTAEAQIRSLIRSLGYGAGIHNFKNYVLRGKDDYRTKAESFLAKALATITALRADASLKAPEKEALDGIEKVVKQYQANLPVAQKMLGEGKSVKEIDTAVKVDDAPAVAGLGVLMSDRKWTNLDRLDASLGYGAAIHNFKNYVLRGKDEYRTNALARMKDVYAAIAALRADKALGEKEATALGGVEGVVKQYEANVATAQKMIGEGKDIKEIDAAVKVDDEPALAALAVLRKE